VTRNANPETGESVDPKLMRRDPSDTGQGLMWRGRMRGYPLHSFCVLLFSYAAFSVLGLRWGMVSGAASPIWPAAGVALAGLLLGGKQLWPAIFLGRIAAYVFIGTSLPLLAQVAIATGNSLSAVIGVEVMRRANADRKLTSARDAVVLITAALVSAAISASVGAAAVSLPAAAPVAWGIVWGHWSAGHLAGSLVLAPGILSWAVKSALRENRQWWLHLFMSLLVASGIAYLVFGPEPTPWARAWLIFPPLIWGALAGGVRGASAGLLAVGGIAVWGTTEGYGPFCDINASTGASTPFFMLSQFLAVAAMTILMLAVVADERRGAELLKQSEARLLESEYRLQLALEAARAGTFEINVSNSNVIVSPGVLSLFGFTEQAQPKFNDYLNRIATSDRDRIQQEIRQTINHGTGHYVEYPLELPGGSERWLASRTEPIRNELGETIRLVGAVLDITERRVAERASRERQRILLLALDASDMGAWELDLHTQTFQLTERCGEILGCAQRLTLSLGDWLSMFQPTDHRRLHSELDRSVQTSEDCVFEACIFRADGSKRWISLRGRPIADDSNSAADRIVGVTRDVTEYRQVEAALQEADRRKDEFLAGARTRTSQSTSPDTQRCSTAPDARKIRTSTGTDHSDDGTTGRPDGQTGG
jgi:PAS domain S-box-containing protein